MRSFAGVGDRFLRDLYTLEGTLFRGTLMPASDREGSALNYSAPRTILRTRAEAEVAPGTIFHSHAAGPLYLIGEHFAAEPDYRSWRLFLLEAEYTWTRPKQGKDDLLGLPKASAGQPQAMGTLWAAIEHDRRMFTDPGLRLKTERVTLITNQPVEVGDLVNGERISRVTRDLGLYVIEHS